MSPKDQRSFKVKNFVSLSHLANKSHYADEQSVDCSRESLSKSNDITSLLGHHFCQGMRLLDPLLELYTGDSWLTLGDGRGGREAFYIQEKKGRVIPSDIDDSLLKRSQAAGVFSEVSQQNAEALSFPDDSFDFVFCKETLHHLPRPYAALYEMLRVAKKGFVFIEPADRRHPFSIQWHEQLDRHFREVERDPELSEYDYEIYESVGSYTYCFTVREIEKFALGAGLRWFAYKGIHVQDLRELKNSYDEFTPATEVSAAFREYSEIQATIVGESERGEKPWGSYAFLVFTLDDLPELLPGKLEEQGWNLKRLSENPYLHENINRALKTIS